MSSIRSGVMWPMSLFLNIKSRAVLFKVWSPGHLAHKCLGFVINTNSKVSSQSSWNRIGCWGKSGRLFIEIPRSFWCILEFETVYTRDSSSISLHINATHKIWKRQNFCPAQCVTGLVRASSMNYESSLVRKNPSGKKDLLWLLTELWYTR